MSIYTILKKINELSNLLDQLNIKYNKLVEKQRNEFKFWDELGIINFTDYINRIRYILIEYGTKLPCNRFDVGNSIEFLIADQIRKCDFTVESLPNNKRIDLLICEIKLTLSIKYSSSGNIKLHNSNNCINNDTQFTDMLLQTPTHLYFITINTLRKYAIDINDFLQNVGDGLILKRSLLTILHKKEYEYKLNINITISECKNQSCAKVFYNKVMSDYDLIHNIE